MSADLQKLERFLVESMVQAQESNLPGAYFERRGEGLVLKSRFADAVKPLAEIGPEELTFMHKSGCYESAGDNFWIGVVTALDVVQKARQIAAAP
ncbi:MAG TPA: hypothetical protein VIG74_04295 [Alphaproteobacteria bacterium]|jgi:hypothetical protein